VVREWYGIVGFNVPLDIGLCVSVISETIYGSVMSDDPTNTIKYDRYCVSNVHYVQ